MNRRYHGMKRAAATILSAAMLAAGTLGVSASELVGDVTDNAAEEQADIAEYGASEEVAEYEADVPADEAREEWSIEEQISHDALDASYSAVQTGLQIGVADNLNNPLSAWKVTNCIYKPYSNASSYKYELRMDAIYTGTTAEAMIADTADFTAAASGQRWLLLKFYLKNADTGTIYVDDLIPNYYTGNTATLFYTSAGKKLTVSKYANLNTTGASLNGKDSHEKTLAAGKSGYYYVGILVNQADGLPYLRLPDGYDETAKAVTYTYLNTEPSYTYDDPVQAFVSRLYETTLDRDPDGDGLRSWTTSLKNNKTDGAHVAYGFYMSQEMTNKNLSDTDFVECVYVGMMGRISDETGRKNWVSALGSGVSRVFVVNGFSSSTEFNNLCAKAGITAGNINDKREYRDYNLGITGFVSRLYTMALGRSYDVNGLNDWCKSIIADSSKANILKVSTTGFLNSSEFTKKGLDNGEYVKVLYRTYLGREYDEAGYKDWVGQLNNGTKNRNEVAAGFANSKEFANIMAQYGL